MLLQVENNRRSCINTRIARKSRPSYLAVAVRVHQQTESSNMFHIQSNNELRNSQAPNGRQPFCPSSFDQISDLEAATTRLSERECPVWDVIAICVRVAAVASLSL